MVRADLFEVGFEREELAGVELGRLELIGVEFPFTGDNFGFRTFLDTRLYNDAFA